jgi:DNA-binding winged helix-turn-helix (wHTH) protein
MAGQLETNKFYEFGPYRLDQQARVLLRDGVIVPLTPKVLDTLLALVENRNGVVSKDELLRLVWPDSFVEESNLAQNISVLRKALGQPPDQVTYIETIPKRGYRFVPEVRIAAAMAQPVAVAPEMADPSAVTVARGWTRILTVAVAVALCAAAAFWYYRQRQPGTPRGPFDRRAAP